MIAKCSNFYIVPMSTVLIVIGGIKLFNIWGDADILSTHDPLLNMPYRHLLFITALVEISSAIYMLISLDFYRKYLVMISLGIIFLFYRLGLMYIKFEGHCPCLGSLSMESVGMSDEIVSAIMLVILGLMLFPSLIVIFYLDFIRPRL